MITHYWDFWIGGLMIALVAVCVTIFAGLQLCVLGMIGEYLGRLFLSSSSSPQFVVRESFGIDNSKR